MMDIDLLLGIVFIFIGVVFLKLFIDAVQLKNQKNLYTYGLAKKLGGGMIGIVIGILKLFEYFSK